MADFEELEGESNGQETASEGWKRPRSRTGGRKFVPKVRVCAFCVDRGARIDYKQPETLRRYVNDHGKIRPRRQTGACARHQRQLAQAIKRARHLAFLPFVGRAR